MQYRILGKTNFEVSRICFGGLTVGPLQKNMTPQDGGKIILSAFERGVNMIDTANMYDTYEHIEWALRSYDRKKIHIMSKDYSYSKETAQKSLERALRELKTDYIDGFLLHEQESEHTLRGHYEALEYFIRMKEKGYIRAVGISTHFVAAVKAAGAMEEIDIIHPIVNKSGIGIVDGNVKEMLDVIALAKKNNKGIYAMKPLGGGNLIKNYDESLDFVLGIDDIDSIAIGMQNESEVIANVLKFNGREIPDDIKKMLSTQKRRLKIANWCQGCGRCVDKCQQNALEIVGGKALVDENKCVLCGYCSKECKEFCIKVI